MINGHCRSFRSDSVHFLISAKIPFAVNVYLAERLYSNTRSNTMRKTRLFVVSVTVRRIWRNSRPRMQLFNGCVILYHS